MTVLMQARKMRLLADLLKWVGVVVIKLRFAVDAHTYLDEVKQGHVSRVLSGRAITLKVQG